MNDHLKVNDHKIVTDFKQAIIKSIESIGHFKIFA